MAESSYNQPNDVPELHLWDFIGMVVQRLHLAVGIFVTIILLTLLYTWTRQPRYEATARILIERKSVDLTQVDSAFEPGSGSTFKDSEFIPTQLLLITSEPVLESVLSNEAILAHPYFANASDPSKALLRLINIRQIGKSRLIEVSVEMEDARMAARVANALVDGYKERERLRRLGISEGGQRELEKKAEELREKLDIVEKQVKAFLQKHSIVSFEHNRNMLIQRSQGLNESLWRTEPLRVSLKARVEEAKLAKEQEIPLTHIPEVLSSPVVSELRIQRAGIEGQYAEHKFRFGEEHPQLKGLEVQMEVLDKQIQDMADAVVASSESEYRIINNEVNYLKEALKAQEFEVSRFSELAADYNLVLTLQKGTKESYQLVSKRIEEISLNNISGQGDNVFVISRADVPRNRSYPSPLLNMVAGGILGFIFAIGACLFIEYMDTSLKTAEDLQGVFDAEVVGAIPSARLEVDGDESIDFLTVNKPHSHFAEAFRILRASLEFGRGEKPPRFIGVTSTLPQEGKSLTSINLAIAFSMAGKKVLIIDGDLRKPRLHDAFKIENTKGLSEILSGVEPISNLESLCTATEVKRLSFLMSGAIPENPAELLESDYFSALIAEAKKLFDVVIFDCPPSLSLVDSTLATKHLDGLLMVVRSHHVQRRTAQVVATHFNASNVQLIGCVLNVAEAPKGGKLYGYIANGYYGERYYTANRTLNKPSKPGFADKFKSKS